MAIVTISRGSATGGLLLAEGLAKTLRYHLVSREEIIQGAAKFGVAEAKLERFMLGPPSFSEDFKSDLRCYLAFIQEALCQWAHKDNVVYLGNVGHLLLREISHVLRIRLIAPLEFRIEMLVKREGMALEQAAAYIEKVDAQRRAWTLMIYGVDWLNPSLYDLTINLENMGIDSAVEVATAAVRCREFSTTKQSRKAMDDLLLTTRVKAALATDPLVASWEIDVQADATLATVFLKGKSPSSLIETAVDIAGRIDGVTKVDKSQLQITDLQS